MKPTEIETMRAQELLMLQATEGLSATEKAELRRVHADTSEVFDVVATMVECSVSHTEAMPQDVADKILQTALASRSGKYANTTTAPAVPAVAAVLTSRQLHVVAPITTSTPFARRNVEPAPNRQPFGQKSSRRAIALYAGWGTAAAAAVVAGWAINKNVEGRPSDAPAVALPTFTADAPPTLTLAWRNDAQPAVTGSVRWNVEMQRGVVEIVALPSNAVTQQRYQLWVFDAQRDEKFPVDAGLFDVTGARTTLVFSPRVKVAKATHFMITLEDANGAVVSNRAHIAAVTQP